MCFIYCRYSGIFSYYHYSQIQCPISDTVLDIFDMGCIDTPDRYLVPSIHPSKPQDGGKMSPNSLLWVYECTKEITCSLFVILHQFIVMNWHV